MSGGGYRLCDTTVSRRVSCDPVDESRNKRKKKCRERGNREKLWIRERGRKIIGEFFYAFIVESKNIVGMLGENIKNISHVKYVPILVILVVEDIKSLILLSTEAIKASHYLAFRGHLRNS